MELPETGSYRNPTARITHSAKDGLYHAYWNCGGHRGKAASKKFERAEGKALAALKQTFPPLLFKTPVGRFTSGRRLPRFMG